MDLKLSSLNAMKQLNMAPEQLNIVKKVTGATKKNFCRLKSKQSECQNDSSNNKCNGLKHQYVPKSMQIIIA